MTSQLTVANLIFGQDQPPANLEKRIARTATDPGLARAARGSTF